MIKNSKDERSAWQKIGDNALSNLTKDEIKRLAAKAQTTPASEKTTLLADILNRHKPNHDEAVDRKEEFRKLRMHHRKESRLVWDDERDIVLVRGTLKKPRQRRDANPT